MGAQYVSTTDYKYFGHYELDDKQKMAVDVLVWTSQKYLEDQLEIKDKYLCDCHKNYGKDCLFPEKYRKEGCS